MASPSVRLIVGPDHAVPIEPQSGVAVVTVDAGAGPVYFSNSLPVSSTVNQGSISGGASQSFTANAWIIASASTGVTVAVTSVYDEWAASGLPTSALGSPGQTITVGSDGTVRYATQSVSNLRDAWQCKCDGALMFGGIPNGSHTFTSVNDAPPAAAIFTAADVGKLIYVPGGGAAGADLITTISAVANPGTSVCTLTAAAQTTVSNKRCFYATNDLDAVQSAIAAVALKGGRLELPPNTMMGIAATAANPTGMIDFGAAMSAPVLGEYKPLWFGGQGGAIHDSGGYGTSVILNFNAGTGIKSYINPVYGLHLRDFTLQCLTNIGQGNFALDISNIMADASIKRVRVLGHASGTGGKRGTDANTGHGVRVDDPQIGQIVLEDVVVQGFDSPPTTLGEPTSLTATPAVGGGSSAGGTFFWKVTALYTAASSIGYETDGSNEATATIAASGTSNLAWTAPSAPPTGALAGFRIYRSTASGGQTTGVYSLVTQVSAATFAYADTITATTLGACPPFNTALTFAGSEGFRFGAELPGPNGLNGNNSGNIVATACRSECTVAFRFKRGALFNGSTFNALKAIMDGTGTSVGTGGLAAYWFESSNQQQHVLNSPHAEGFQLGYWFNGSQGVLLNAPLASLPSGSAVGDGSTAFLYDNGATNNEVRAATVGGSAAFDYAVRFHPGGTATGNAWMGRFQTTFASGANTTNIIRNGLNHYVDTSLIAWQAVSLQTGFVNPASANSGPPEVRVGYDGKVAFRGLISASGAQSANAVILLLPAALIPPMDAFQVAFVQNSSLPSGSDMMMVQVCGQSNAANAGKIRLVHSTSGGGNIDLSAVSFSLEPPLSAT